MRTTIVGMGRLGTSLGKALVQAGYEIVALADSDIQAARRAKRRIGRGRSTDDTAAAVRRADLIFISVPDEAIIEVVRSLVSSGFQGRGKTVFHTSGIETSLLLAPLACRGARVASFHPAQSFPKPTMPPVHFHGTVFGLEGNRAAVKTAKSIVRNLGGHALVLSPEGKTLYHAACAVASNLFVPLIGLAIEIMIEAGVTKSEAKTILFPLIEGTLRNVKRLDAAEALSGPLARLDSRTIKRHLQALRRVPGAREVYRAIGLSAMGLLKKRGAPAASLKHLRFLLAEK